MGLENLRFCLKTARFQRNLHFQTDSCTRENVGEVRSVRKTSSWCGKSWHVSLVVNRKKLGVFYRCSFTILFCRHTDIFVCCERRAEVAIRVSDQSPKGLSPGAPEAEQDLSVRAHQTFPTRNLTAFSVRLPGLEWLKSFLSSLFFVFLCSPSNCKTFCVYEMILWTSTSVFDCQKTLQEFKSSKVK